MIDNFFDPKNLYDSAVINRVVLKEPETPVPISFGRRLAIWLLRLGNAGRKRALLLTSVYAYIYGKKAFDMDTLVKFNKAFNLAQNANSLEFPVRIGEWVWRGTSEIIPMPTGLLRVTDIQSQTLNEEEITYIATEISSRIPKWLIYGQLATVANEIRTVVYHVYNETRPPTTIIKD